jgi:pyruvate/2-oxoglutarate dehydrogenase complex dihydrolipoamide dehydrogenase (E3) component
MSPPEPFPHPIRTVRYDAIVIGTGQSGPSLAARLAASGRRVAIVERKRFGGTCVNNGCIPTKALVASARAAYIARRAADFGVGIDGPVRVDMRKVKERKDTIVARSSTGVETWLKSTPNLTVYEGHGRFTGPHTVAVNGQEMEAPWIFINVGGRAWEPPIPGLEAVPFRNNSSMMAVDFLPEHLVIIGGSYIGLEFGQMYRRFGSEVTVIERGPRILSREDDDISDAIRQIVENEGIRIVTNACDFAVERRGEGVAVIVTCQGNATEVAGSHLLVAVGRRPNTHDLGLEKAGIETDQNGFIRVDDQCRTNVEGVWAIGDCNGRGAFTHTSYNDYEIVAANLLDHDPRRLSDRFTAYALYIDPPLGRAGLTEKEVRRSGRPALVATRPMSRVGRAVERSETQGFMKILVDAESKLILGAAMLGIEGDEIIHSILDVMYARAPYTVIQRAMHIHPTVSELIPTLLGDLKPLT